MLEQFVVRSYTSTLDSVIKVIRAIYEIFQFQGNGFDDLLPSQNVLILHIHRGAYTAGYIWRQA